VTQTVIASSSTTVVTVTQPAEVITDAGAVAQQPALVTVTIPARKAPVARHLVRARRVTHRVVKEVVVVVTRLQACPPGTRLSNGRCAAIIHGNG
jgi:hypothetical protein